jgi:hypothetical protein
MDSNQDQDQRFKAMCRATDMSDTDTKRLEYLLIGRPLPRVWSPNLSRYDQVMQRGFADLLVELMTMVFGTVPTDVVKELQELEPRALHVLFELCATARSLSSLMDDARLLDKAIAPVKRMRFPMNFPHFATGPVTKTDVEA